MDVICHLSRGFNPRPPSERATKSTTVETKTISVSIHALREGATLHETGAASRSAFQSTPPPKRESESTMLAPAVGGFNHAPSEKRGDIPATHGRCPRQ